MSVGGGKEEKELGESDDRLQLLYREWEAII